jgi:hypothetical protein
VVESAENGLATAGKAGTVESIAQYVARALQRSESAAHCGQYPSVYETKSPWAGTFFCANLASWDWGELETEIQGDDD